MRDVSIIAVGMTPFRHRPESFTEIGADGIIDAFNDDMLKNLEMEDIQAAYCGTRGGGPQAGQRVLARLKGRMEEKGLEGKEGLTGIPIFNYENMCVSGTNAFQAGYRDVALGMYDIVLCFGVEKLGRGSLSTDEKGALTTEKFEGPPPVPYMFSLNAHTHMEKYGTTREQLAMIAVKSKEYASRNPNAQYRQLVTVDEVLDSPMVADPLTILMCCPTSTGGGACILAASDIAKKYNELPVKILASVLKTSKADVSFLVAGWDPNIRAGREAYRLTGLTPKDIDVAQVHDCFAIAELMHYESFGWCKMGEGGKWVEEGGPCKDGGIPVNTDGGLISKGHPLGATGFAQVYELVHQLRGDAHTQISPKPKIAWQHNMGGGVGIGMAYAVNVLGEGW